jgi:hypothetical protein
LFWSARSLWACRATQPCTLGVDKGVPLRDEIERLVSREAVEAMGSETGAVLVGGAAVGAGGPAGGSEMAALVVPLAAAVATNVVTGVVDEVVVGAVAELSLDTDPAFGRGL